MFWRTRLSGEIFKKRREELGIDIKEASAILKIGSEYLYAIENDIFERLPVAVYTIGYIRCYAKYLDVDAGPVIANFTSHLSSPKPSTIIPVSSSKRKVPGYAYVVLVLLAGLLTFVVYAYTSKNRAGDLSAKSIKPSVKEEISVPPAPPANAKVIARESDEQNSRENIAQSAPVSVDRKEHRLEIIARETSWVRIGFENGSHEEALLRAGVSKDWRFSGPAVLKIGNAGGVSLRFDGKDLGVPGKSGQIMNLNFPPS